MKGLEVNSCKSFHWQNNRGALDWVVCRHQGPPAQSPQAPRHPQLIPRTPLIVHLRGKVQ